MNKILKFLNLLDKGGNLSITNVTVYVAIVKLALAPSLSFEDVGFVLLALLNYAHKRHLNSKIPAPVPSVNVDEIRNDLDKVKLALGFREVKANSK